LESAKQGLNKVIQQTDSLEKTGADTKCLVTKLLNRELGLSTAGLPC
jgi:hypothetical protein